LENGLKWSDGNFNELYRSEKSLSSALRPDLFKMNLPDKTLPLKNGGYLAYDEYGQKNGKPVFFCHGWPSSSTMARLTDAAASDLGVRIVSPDRPGISGSTFQPNRRLVDWPPVLCELADHLGLGQFHILAISGGAPYAFVTAWAMPQRVRAIAVVSGAVPISDLSDHSGLLALYRWMLALNRRNQQLLRALFYLARPFATLNWGKVLLKLLQPCDADALRDSAAFEACFESQRRAWRGSVKGVLADAHIHAVPWGFRLEDVNVPVRLWHGKQDRAFSFRVAQEVAERLPNCEARFIEGAGHYSLPIRYMQKILADLISS
jgi:pimeloyl-ACP methyl ester carboxylesterase